MKRTLHSLLALGILCLPVAAQTPETVTSEAQRAKDEQLSRRFVQSVLQPSLSLDGQFAKWTKKPLCVHVSGLAPVPAHAVEQRIREVAQKVGAPVDHKDPCTANAIIFVTADPLGTLDALAQKDLLRFVSGVRKDLKVRYPVQSWYTNYFIDTDGQPHYDIPWVDASYGGPGVWTDTPADSDGVSARPKNDDMAQFIKSNDSRLRHGIQPQMGNITIIVDATAIAGMTLNSLSDYLAMMTLSQTPARTRCQPAPSIANLFLKDCDAALHVTGLSNADLAMLSALYETPLEPENLQMTRIIGTMRRNLETPAKN